SRRALSTPAPARLRPRPCRARRSSRLPSGLHHHLDRFALVHRPVAVGHLVEAEDAVEDAAGFDAAFEDVRQELLEVRADRGGAAAHADVVEEGRPRGGHRLVLWDADAADCATGPSNLDCRELRLLEADALEDGVDAVVVCELAHALDRLVSSLADDVGRAELARERAPVRLP